MGFPDRYLKVHRAYYRAGCRIRFPDMQLDLVFHNDILHDEQYPWDKMPNYWQDKIEAGENLNNLIKPLLNSVDKKLVFLSFKGNIISYGKLNNDLFIPKKILLIILFLYYYYY